MKPRLPGKEFQARFNRMDRHITRWMARHGIKILRIGLGVVFLWFGALKLVPGLSPAEDLVRNTIYFVEPDWFLPVLAIWEMAIGLGLIVGKFMRITLLLLMLQMPGTALPLVLLPDAVWTQFPYGQTDVRPPFPPGGIGSQDRPLITKGLITKGQGICGLVALGLIDPAEKLGGKDIIEKQTVSTRAVTQGDLPESLHRLLHPTLRSAIQMPRKPCQKRFVLFHTRL